MRNIFLLFFLLSSIATCFSSTPYILELEVNDLILKSQNQNASVKTSKDVYIEHEEITVIFSGLPGSSGDWITLINPSASAREYGNWKYTKGKTSGSLTFKGMSEGDYEVRVYFGTDYIIQTRYPFKVITSTKTASLEEIINSSPAKNYIYSLTERLDKLEKLKNSSNWGSEETMMLYPELLKTAPIHLKNLIATDPNFDVSDLQKRLEMYQTFYDDNLDDVNDTNLAKADFEKAVTAKSWKLTNLLDEKLGSGAAWVHDYFNTSKYLNDATEIDYPSLLKITIEGDNKFKGHNMDYKVQTVKEFGGKYLTYYNETLQNVINGLIEGAYENKAGNKQAAVKYIEQAKQLSEATLLILPQESSIKNLNMEVMSAYNSITSSVYTQVFTSDFHKNNVGKVVFFNKKPTIKSENTSSVNENFKAGDFIYAMAYLPGSFKDLTDARNSINVTTTIYVDGSEKTSHEFGMSWALLKENKTYLYMEIIPNPVTNKQSGPAKFAKSLANISPRNHEIKVSLTGLGIGLSNIVPFAEGTFNIDCSTGQDQLANYALRYKEKTLAGVYMPSAKLNNSGLIQSMKQALQVEGWENNKKVQRVVITGSDWNIYHHRVTGKIMYRTIPATAAFKTSEGECKYWNLTFKQVYNGTSYGKTVVGAVGSIVELSCKNIN